MRFYVYTGNKTITLKETRLKEAYSKAAMFSRREGESFLYDKDRDKTVAHFQGGSLVKNPSKQIDPTKYWYEKGFNDACLGVRKRNRIAAYLRGYRDGTHYCETREKYGHPTERTKNQKRKANPVTAGTVSRVAGALLNPRRGVKIYGRLLRIEAQKTQPHVCDAKCAKANHCYYHDFKPGASVYGMPDGSLYIK